MMTHRRTLMAVLRFSRGAEKSQPIDVIECDPVSAESTDDSGRRTSLRQLPAPEMIATSDLQEKLAAASAAISNIQEILGEVGIGYDELRRTVDDLKRDRDEWRCRAERLTE